jgi:hypothetical protein
MPWAYILKLLGPGAHWGRTQEELHTAIKQAELDNRADAAEHLRIIHRLRNRVYMEKDPAD